MRIIDTPVVETENEYTKDIENLIAQGEGHSGAYDVEAGDNLDARINSLKLKVQRAANKLDRTARSQVQKNEDGSAVVIFTLRPKQKQRTSGDTPEASADENPATETPTEVPAEEPTPEEPTPEDVEPTQPKPRRR